MPSLVAVAQHQGATVALGRAKYGLSDALWHNESSVVSARKDRVFARFSRFRFGRYAELLRLSLRGES